MGHYLRLWLLLVAAFAAVFGMFVDHDLVLVGYHGPGSTQIKSKTPPSEVFALSLLAGVLISTCVTAAFCGVEQLALAASRRWGSAA